MLSEQEIIRREKLSKLKELGINPYPAPLYPVDTTSKDVANYYEEGKQVVVAGRLMSLRVQGKASFATLQDSEGTMQLYFNRDEMCPTDDKTLYNEVFKKLLDLGDFIGAEGTLFITKMGEKTVLVKNFTLLSKVLRPLPMPKVDADGKVHDAFTDPEQRYRMRYVDLVVNPQVKEVFIKRTKLFNAMRQFFNDAGYLEVETPILQAIPGGASARPFITHHNALDIPLYMRIANELYLKRLIVGGFDGVYEFSKNFRNEGMDRTHNPEFTAMEIYVAYKDYHWMMDFTERLIEHCAMAVNGTTKATFGKHTVDFKAPYPRLTMTDAIKQFTGFDITGKTEDELRAFAQSIGIAVDEAMGKGKLIDEIFGEKCEGNFIQPTFITDYPKEIKAFYMRLNDDGKTVAAMDLLVPGIGELIGGSQREERYDILKEKMKNSKMDISEYNWYLDLRKYGGVNHGGYGLGFERMLMYLTGMSNIRDVLLFPRTVGLCEY